MRDTFLGNSLAKHGGEASRRPFYKKSKLRISPDQQSEMLCNLFFFCVKVEVYQNTLNLRC